MARMVKLGKVTYVLEGRVIVWYLDGKQDGRERFKTEGEAEAVMDELEVPEECMYRRAA